MRKSIKGPSTLFSGCCFLEQRLRHWYAFKVKMVSLHAAQVVKGYAARLKTSVQGFASSTESAANKAKEVPLHMLVGL